MIKNILCAALLVVALAGCVNLQKGADPIVVRAEQSETVATATFDTFLKIDNGNREFFRTNFPPMHAFAEYLRSPVFLNGTNVLPRGLAFVSSLEAVKESYKHGAANSNVLATAIAVLESSVLQAQIYVASQNQLPNAPAPAPPTAPTAPTPLPADGAPILSVPKP